MQVTFHLFLQYQHTGVETMPLTGTPLINSQQQQQQSQNEHRIQISEKSSS
jgi:hypothetical protein